MGRCGERKLAVLRCSEMEISVETQPPRFENHAEPSRKTSNAKHPQVTSNAKHPPVEQAKAKKRYMKRLREESRWPQTPSTLHPAISQSWRFTYALLIPLMCSYHSPPSDLPSIQQVGRLAPVPPKALRAQGTRWGHPPQSSEKKEPSMATLLETPS